MPSRRARERQALNNSNNSTKRHKRVVPFNESLIEKPKNPPSNMAVTGIYFYDGDCFKVCKDLKPSGRGELEITDVNNYYLNRGDMTYETLEGWWTDAGTFESLFRASKYVAESGANHLDLAGSRPGLFGTGVR